uniref:EOG090X0FS7 n=2 Tax=Daphnia similis TaxID=35528 RepID=A0A4Y7LVJ4_9CRUS|nr:EOG090X0FS7 [Daphnia similis]SVE72005.1 EOG090X0FS7 [Daphnia similis]
MKSAQINEIRTTIGANLTVKKYLEMSDSENESNSVSLQHDLMSVSDQEGDGSRDEDDMPSAEIDVSEGPEQARSVQEEDSIATNSTSNEDLAQLPAAEEFVCGAKNLLETKNPIRDLDEAALVLGMSGSYSEILSPSHFKTEVVPADDAKPSIQNLAVEGTVVKEGDMIHFIAKNLESKIRLSSPDISESSQIVSQSELAKHGQSIGTPESTFLAQLERDARSIAASVDGLTEHLAVSLHTISAVTAQSLTVYKDSVCKTCDAMDSNIKSMYQLMAKCEELSKAMTPIYKLADQVKEIKKLLDIMENLS